MTDTPHTSIARIETKPAQQEFSRLLGRFIRSHNVVAGSIILGIIIVLVVLAPIIAPFEPTEQFRRERLQPPNATYWFGTDNLGRDVFSRVLYGGRIFIAGGYIFCCHWRSYRHDFRA